MLDTVMRDMADAARIHRAELRSRCAGAECVESRMGLEHEPGAKVFDLVTGQEVTIVRGEKTHRVVPASGS
jgi:hypothetical protein